VGCPDAPWHSAAFDEEPEANSEVLTTRPSRGSLVEVQLTETFSGDIAGDSTVRVIQAAHDNGSMSFVGLQRVRGSVDGRTGSFVLQPTGTVVGKETNATWSVVPGSGTEGLKGLRGDGGFKAQLGEHGAFWLDYYVE
jgi:hypothetical protein